MNPFVKRAEQLEPAADPVEPMELTPEQAVFEPTFDPGQSEENRSEERGSGGFGYDPIFLLRELGKTMAELTMEEKNRLSHRARAVMNAKPILEKLL